MRREGFIGGDKEDRRGPELGLALRIRTHTRSSLYLSLTALKMKHVDGSEAERKLAQWWKLPEMRRVKTMFSRSCSCGGRGGGGELVMRVLVVRAPFLAPDRVEKK